MTKTYYVSRQNLNNNGSLVDRVANGGIASKWRNICSDDIVHIMGIHNYKLESISIVTAGGVSELYLEAIQLELFQHTVHDISIKLGW